MDLDLIKSPGGLFAVGAVLVAGFGFLFGLIAVILSTVAGFGIWLSSIILLGAALVAAPPTRNRIITLIDHDLRTKHVAASVASLTVISMMVFSGSLLAIPTNTTPSGPPDQGGVAPTPTVEDSVEETPTTTEAQVDDTTPTATAAGTVTDEELQSAFRGVVSEEVYRIDHLSESGGVVFLEYRSSASAQEEITSEIGWVAGSYAETRNQSWSVESLEVTILTADGDIAGSYYINSEWADQYNNGEITLNEYLRLVLETLEDQ